MSTTDQISNNVAPARPASSGGSQTEEVAETVPNPMQSKTDEVPQQAMRTPRLPNAGRGADSVSPNQFLQLMEEWQIEDAINRAKPGIAQYVKIMALLPSVNVAGDREFQRIFNGFYRVMRRSSDWYETYYSFMERGKQAKPTFDETLDHFWSALGRCEASFSSKLVATVDPGQPIWDANVLKNLGIARPRYSKNRVMQTKDVYRSLWNWYVQFLPSAHGKLLISLFDSNVKEHAQITDVKKVDFVLWQLRPV